MNRPPFGINFFGYVSGNFGLAVAARNTLEMLLATRTPTVVHDTRLYDGRSGQHNEFRPLYARPLRPMPYGVNLFHLNPDDVLNRIPLQWIFTRIEQRMNAIVPFWELPSLPEEWRTGLEMMDLILAPTLYVKEVIEAAVPGATVIHFPQAVHLPDNVSADRHRWGLPAEDVVFLSGFDVLSDINRKNPWGAIEAFRSAFPGEEPVQLLVRLNNAGVNAEYAHLIEELRGVAATDPRIRVIDEPLSYREVLSLYASCDAFVSLHRAEGLGLILMEMMSMGKPVIATAWSGNMDFSTEDNSCLVGFDMIPVTASHAAYRSEAGVNADVRWAEPHVSEAADWMRALATDADLRARIGTQASADMMARARDHSSPVLVEQIAARFYEFDVATEPHARKARDIRAWRHRNASRRLARIPRAAVKIAARMIGSSSD